MFVTGGPIKKKLGDEVGKIELLPAALQIWAVAPELSATKEIPKVARYAEASVQPPGGNVTDAKSRVTVWASEIFQAMTARIATKAAAKDRSAHMIIPLARTHGSILPGISFFASKPR